MKKQPGRTGKQMAGTPSRRGPDRHRTRNLLHPAGPTDVAGPPLQTTDRFERNLHRFGPAQPSAQAFRRP
jgi:hypothetical protein